MRQKIICWSKKHLTSRRTCAGQAMIEFALMLPALAVVLMGVIDLGRAYYAYTTIVNAGREGARYGAAHPPKYCANQSSDGVEAIVRHTVGEAVDSSGLNPSRLSVNVVCPTGSNAYGNPIMVETSYQFQMTTIGLLGGGPIGLYSSTQMQIFNHDTVP